MANALVCLQNLPEMVEFYYVPNLTDDERLQLARANHHFLNSDRNSPKVEQAICNVMAAFDKNPENWKSSNVPKAWLNKGWHKYRLDQSKLNRIKPCVLINTGCFM